MTAFILATSPLLPWLLGLVMGAAFVIALFDAMAKAEARSQSTPDILRSDDCD